jgi:hypothetical protein
MSSPSEGAMQLEGIVLDSIHASEAVLRRVRIAIPLR